MTTEKLILDLTLGDGHLTKPKSAKGNSLLRMHHSLKQKDYVLHKKKLLEEAGLRAIYRERQDGKFQTCYVMTGKKPEITRVRNLLYINGKKSLPKEVLGMIDERSIAYFFQDDGSFELCKKQRKKLKSGSVSYDVKPYINQFILCLMCFTENEVHGLRERFEDFGLESRLINRKGYALAISKNESKNKFVEIIKPYISESMMYKIDKSLCTHGRI